MTHSAIRYHDSPPATCDIFDTGEGSVLSGYQPRNAQTPSAFRNATAWGKPTTKRNRKRVSAFRALTQVSRAGWIISAPVAPVLLAPVLLALVLLGIAFLAGYNAGLSEMKFRAATDSRDETPVGREARL